MIYKHFRFIFRLVFNFAAIAAFFVCASPIFAAVTVDNTSSAGTFDTIAGVTSLTFPHTVNACTNCVLYVKISTYTLNFVPTARVNPATITYAGLPLTLVGTQVSPLPTFPAVGNSSVEIFRLVSPPVGVGNVVVNFLVPVNYTVGAAISLNGVSRNAPDGSLTPLSGNSASFMVNIPATLVGDFVLDSLSSAPVFLAAGAGQIVCTDIIDETTCLRGRRFFNDAPTITAPGTGRAFESNASRFTSAIASVRSTSNLTANGLTADAELAPGLVPFYTQISGTSMATPFVAGTVALMLDADPTLSPDEIKQILVDSASRMPGYDDFEVGAGYVNSYAAVDKVFNRTKNYQNIQSVSFNAVFGEERPAAQTFHIDFNPAASGAGSVNSTTFTVEPNMSVLDVSAVADTFLEEGTGNLVGIRLTSPSGVNYSTAIDFPVIGSNRREIVVDNPQAGTWTLEVRGARGLTAAPQANSPTQAALPGPVDGNVTQIKFILPNITDIQGNTNQSAIEFAIKNRVIDTYADGTFRPGQTVSREDLGRSLVLNSSLRQTLGLTPKFGDVSGNLINITEAVTAKGSSLRDYDFVANGFMSSTGTSFNPTGAVNRLDVAVALVRALGHDAQARALANSTVTFNGAALSDNTQIPANLRGYVQIAINNGMFEAFPAQVIQIAPGQFQVLPGPRFEPATTLNRGIFAIKLNRFRELFTIGG